MDLGTETEQHGSVSIGERIREARKKLGLSQEALGRKINSSGHRIWRYEDGRSEPSGSNLLALANALGVSAGWLYYGNEAQQPELEEVVMPAFERFVRSRGVPDELADYLRRQVRAFGGELSEAQIAIIYPAVREIWEQRQKP